jgi:hypothetical protein
VGVINVANDNTIDLRVKKKTFEIPLAHPAGPDEPKADLIINTGFGGANRADEWESDTS